MEDAQDGLDGLLLVLLQPVGLYALGILNVGNHLGSSGPASHPPQKRFSASSFSGARPPAGKGASLLFILFNQLQYEALVSYLQLSVPKLHHYILLSLSTNNGLYNSLLQLSGQPCKLLSSWLIKSLTALQRRLEAGGCFIFPPFHLFLFLFSLILLLWWWIERYHVGYLLQWLQCILSILRSFCNNFRENLIIHNMLLKNGFISLPFSYSRIRESAAIVPNVVKLSFQWNYWAEVFRPCLCICKFV